MTPRSASSRRTTVAFASTLAAIGLLALLAAPAPAFPAPRLFSAQLTENLNSPSGIGFDSSGDVWIGAETAVREYGPYPSVAEIASQSNPPSGFPCCVRPTFDSVNSSLYVAESNALYNQIYVFENGTGPLKKTIQIGGLTYFLRVATDNSTGRLYISDGLSVQALESSEAPHGFTFLPPHKPGEYEYIHANELTGTPSGAFGELINLATDSKGDIYAVDRGHKVVDEFAPSGEFLREFTGAGAPGGFTGEVDAVAIDPNNGNVLIGERSAGVIDEFEPTGGYLTQITGTTEAKPFGFGLEDVAINPAGDLYVIARGSGSGADIFTPNPLYPTLSYRPVSELSHDSATLGASIGPNGGGNIVACRFEYGTNTEYTLGSIPCLNESNAEVGTKANPITEQTTVHGRLSALHGNTIYHYRLVIEDEKNSGALDVADREFETSLAVTALKALPVTELTQESATLTASFTEEEGISTKYFFEYGTSTNYGHTTATVSLPGSASKTAEVAAPVANLVPATTYHFRIVAENKFGTTDTKDETFTTYQIPTVTSFSSSHVTTTTADLEATINPQGLPSGTTAQCRFEYGATTSYGSTAACPEPLDGTSPQPVQVHIEGLQSGVTYHFRVIAQNKWGAVTSEDQTFEFFPPSCPNSTVRQQTHSSYLPDCRAYELVSPANANGTLLYSGGPTSPYATSPSRFAYTGAYSSLPGTEPIGADGDLYVATRTDTGWVSHYLGLPGNKASCMGPPPNNPWASAVPSDKFQDYVFTDGSMSRFLDFLDGPGVFCYLVPNGNSVSDNGWLANPASNAPYLWSAEGASLGRLPSALESTPAVEAALNCPLSGPEGGVNCTSTIAASGDLSHLAFSSNRFSFVPGGSPTEPGGAFDDDLATGDLTRISELRGGGHIPQGEPGSRAFIQFPGVSADGSHILMTSPLAPEHCASYEGHSCPDPDFTETPTHLYMSIDDEPAVEISRSEPTGEGVAVNYVGMTPDGSRVYFTSEEHLTAEDPNHGGTSLYMWSQKGEEDNPPHPLTLISKAAPGSTAEAGNTESCSPAIGKKAHFNIHGELREVDIGPWTTKCGALPYSGWAYTIAPGVGGNGHSDSAIAANGDIYFFSPEQLDGDRGILNQQNLYRYSAAEDRVHYVTTFTPGIHCQFGYERRGEIQHEEVGVEEGNACPSGPIARLQVTPDDSHIAFVTADRLTTYDNGGHTEMYAYTPATGTLVCDSCNPSGRPANADVFASQNGLFLTNDGRTFFSTAESLVPRDTNQSTDVYEFVDGRPQLITPGTGTAENTGTVTEVPGLIGVSANGTDVYFSTYDVLTAEDHNGNFLKFYDARTNGGFPQPPPAQPCAAAEECHGPGTEPPVFPARGTAAELSGGNATPGANGRHKKHHKRAKHKRHQKRGAHRRRASR